MNRATIIGNLGQDPELRFTADGKAICNLSLATSRSWKDKNGQKQTETEWHKISLFGRSAEIAGEYLKKGNQTCITGRLKTRKWQDNQGVDRWTTEIICENLELLSNRGTSDNQQARKEPGGPPTSGGYGQGVTTQADRQPPQDDFEDDLPF